MCVCAYVCACTSLCPSTSIHSEVRGQLSFDHERLGAWIQVTRIGHRHLYLLSHFAGPEMPHLCTKCTENEMKIGCPSVVMPGDS